MNSLKSFHCIKSSFLRRFLSPIYGQKCGLVDESDKSVRLSYELISPANVKTCPQTTSVSPILVFHGLFGNKNNWKSISKSLASRTGRSVYAFDLRNHGSSPQTSTMSLRQMSSDIKRFLDENNYKKATLIGHSLGGRTVYQFGFFWPERVEKLIAVDITPFPTIPSSFFTNTTFFDEMSKAIENISIDLSLSESRKQVNQRLEPIITDQFIRGFFLMSLDKSETRQLFWRFNLNAIKDMILNNDINRIEIKSVFCGECLLIHGQNSQYVQEEDYNRIREVMPNVEIVSIPGTGHYLHIERPNEFISTVLSFLKSN